MAHASSSNYRIDEYFLGPGGSEDLSSTSYSARASVGDTGVGNTSSSNYQLYGGYTTTTEPFLEFGVDTTSIDFGVLTTSSASTGTSTFYIRSYLSGGYIVTTESDTPGNSGHNLDNLTSQTASSPGTEQFGINLVANTSPSSFGEDPEQVPDSSFSFGQAATGYDTADVYKYVKGDTVAYSDTSSGRTNFTISYLANISELTPGGIYTMNHVLVAVPTY